MSKPRLLDLFCGAGGAAMGYHRAGFDVVGVDIQPQPNYPFEVWRVDALEVLNALEVLKAGKAVHYLTEDFDAIHASPPCQAYSSLNAYNDKEYPDLVAVTRDLLKGTGLPYVIENVPGAPLESPIQLCGTMFGLRVFRHRLFECGEFSAMALGHGRHEAICARNGVLPDDEDGFYTVTGGKHSKAWIRGAREAMEVPWMETVREVAQAIPPAYTEHIGHYLKAAIHATPVPA